MVFTKNPTYWRLGQPYLDELDVRVLSDESQRYNSLLTGEVDLTWLNTLPIQKQAKDADMSVAALNSIGSNGFNMNMQKEPFNDVRVRKAVQLAVDPVQLNQVTTNGLGEPITALFAKNNTFYASAGDLPRADPAEAQKLID